jgi:hypothetical protein
MIDWKLKDTIFVLFPKAEICTDNEGQVIIYTGEQMDKVFYPLRIDESLAPRET